MPVAHFYQSSEQTCGPACLRMLFAALGAAHVEAAVAQKCGLTALGCTVQDLVLGAQAFGFNAGLLPVRSEPDAIAALSNQAPFVAMIDLASMWNTLPMFQWHFVVPLRVFQGAVVFHDPADGPDCRAPSRRLPFRLGHSRIPRSERMDPMSRVRDYLLDNVGHMTYPGNASFDPPTQRWYVPVFCRSVRGSVVVGDVELDQAGHIVFAPSKEDMLALLEPTTAIK